MAIKMISEGEYGVYVWLTDEDQIVKNEDGDIMNIASKRGDQHKMDLLKQAARYYGIDNGRAVFYGNHRQISENEYQEQKQRQRMGLIPDPLDYTAIQEELSYGRQFD